MRLQGSILANTERRVTSWYKAGHDRIIKRYDPDKTLGGIEDMIMASTKRVKNIKERFPLGVSSLCTINGNRVRSSLEKPNSRSTFASHIINCIPAYLSPRSVLQPNLYSLYGCIQANRFAPFSFHFWQFLLISQRSKLFSNTALGSLDKNSFGY